MPYSMRPATGNQIQLAAEKVYQHDAEPKIGQGDADERDAHTGVIEQRIVPDRRINA